MPKSPGARPGASPKAQRVSSRAKVLREPPEPAAGQRSPRWDDPTMDDASIADAADLVPDRTVHAVAVWREVGGGWRWAALELPAGEARLRATRTVSEPDLRSVTLGNAFRHIDRVGE